MPKIAIVIYLIFISPYSYGNSLTVVPDTTRLPTNEGVKDIPGGDAENNEEEKVYNKVEIDARFPGGDKEWRKYLERTLNAATPVDRGAPAGTYTVVVQFVVDKEGNISDVKALTNHGYGMEAEVIRVIRKGPKWEPAMQNERMVKAYRKQPVTFQVIDERRKRKNKD
jgi:periplasmic protein TonB